MALSRKSARILQFTLIICISAIIAGLAGGLTSRISKRSTEVEGKEETMRNATIRMEENVEIKWSDSRDMGQEPMHEGGFEGVGHERCRRRERRRVVGGRRYEL
ncbi:hypothetical protein DL98DRAFT_522291 [Cadophora sp. DSE1049]|nr:hypothetical protein DL98DRAFT_522291 [Cadophora sp. DSE1049]